MAAFSGRKSNLLSLDLSPQVIAVSHISDILLLAETCSAFKSSPLTLLYSLIPQVSIYLLPSNLCYSLSLSYVYFTLFTLLSLYEEYILLQSELMLCTASYRLDTEALNIKFPPKLMLCNLTIKLVCNLNCHIVHF